MLLDLDPNFLISTPKIVSVSGSLSHAQASLTTGQKKSSSLVKMVKMVVFVYWHKV